jgi:hypothetical protein
LLPTNAKYKNTNNEKFKKNFTFPPPPPKILANAQQNNISHQG